MFAGKGAKTVAEIGIAVEVRGDGIVLVLQAERQDAVQGKDAHRLVMMAVSHGIDKVANGTHAIGFEGGQIGRSVCGFVFKLYTLAQVDGLHDLLAIDQYQVGCGCGVVFAFAEHLRQDLIHAVGIGDMIFAIRQHLDMQSHLLGYIFTIVIECALRHGSSIFVLGAPCIQYLLFGLWPFGM